MTSTSDASSDRHYGGLPIEWRVSRAALAVCRTGVTLAVISILAMTMWALASPDADRLAAALVAGFSLLVALLLWRAGIHPALVASEDGVVIRNPLDTVRISWDDVVKVVPDVTGVTVFSVGMPPQPAWAVQKSNLAIWRRAQTRADAVAARIWELAVERGASARATDSEPARLKREVAPSDAVRRPLRFPWRMTRVEAAVIGSLRHSTSPLPTAAWALVFGVMGALLVGFVVDDAWDSHLLAQRGIVVDAAVVDVGGLVEVTWPAIHPETILLESDGEATERYAAGQTVKVVSDPRQPTRALLVGYEPSPWSSLAFGAGALFLGSGYLKWWLWLVLDRRATPRGRHRA